jgi:nitrogen fixation/metabolism regulation signal transduction histidine kinase
MAERIADPVNRLTRATRRIARGDLDARIVTSSADELRRLVDAFNSMAADLQRQRASSNGRTASRRGPTWRGRWRTTSRTR